MTTKLFTCIYREDNKSVVREKPRSLDRFLPPVEYVAPFVTNATDGQTLEEGKDFYLQPQYLGGNIESMNGVWLDCEEQDYHDTNVINRRIIAIPVAEEKEELITDLEDIRDHLLKMESRAAAPLEQGEKEEDDRILNAVKVDAIVRNWFDEWCEKTKRGGGVLITTSIKEVLTDFYNSFAPAPVHPPVSVEEMAKELWKNTSGNDSYRLGVHDGFRIGYAAAMVNGGQDVVGFRLMDIAPKDGTFILLADEDKSVHKAAWITDADVRGKGRKAWCVADTYQDEQGGFYIIDNPVGWLPLPKMS